MINHDDTVAIAIQRNTQVRAVIQYNFAQQIRLRGTTILIDIQAVRVYPDGNHLGTQLIEHTGSYLVGCTVGTIDNNF